MLHILCVDSNKGTSTVMLREADRIINTNECATKYNGENRGIYLPIAYINHSGSDYTAVVSTGLEVAGKCTGVYGKLYILVNTYSANICNINGFLTSSSNGGPGITAYHDPNTLGLGLAILSGYAKTVELQFQYNGANPRILSLVYYEDK